MSSEELLKRVPTLDIPKASAVVSTKKIVIAGGSVGGLAIAACLKKAGFSDITVYERNASIESAGAGVGVDDCSAAILKGLEIEIPLQKTRYIEEMVAPHRLLQRQPYPYWSTRYVELRAALRAKVNTSLRLGQRVHGVEQVNNGCVEFKLLGNDGPENELRIQTDVFIAADGPRSSFRELVLDPQDEKPKMRYAGYSAWRGVVSRSTLSDETAAAIGTDLPLLDQGNVLLFTHGVLANPRTHCVCYDIGKGLINWLIYEPRPPETGHKTTVHTVPEDESNALRCRAHAEYGKALGGIIAETKEGLFRTDIYDLETPLPRLAKGSIAICGDAAHATTPHVAKGSNMALHDAYALAVAAQNATSIQDWLQRYSDLRTMETRNTVLFSRHMGRLRNGLLSDFPSSAPASTSDFIARVRSSPYEARTLPVAAIYQKVWDFVRTDLLDTSTCSHNQDFFYTVQHRPLDCVGAHHIARESYDIQASAQFYSSVLGLPRLERPPFDFDGAWFQLSNGLQLHLIERDPKYKKRDLPPPNRLPEAAIRRDNHIAIAVSDISAAKARLSAHGIQYAVNAVPGNSGITQLFFYDPDGHGIEIGNFYSDAAKN